MGRVGDFIRIWRLPGGPRIFFRREYDHWGGRLRRWAGFYRRHWLKETRIVAVVGSLGKTTARRALMAALDCPRRNYSYSNYGSSLAENLLRIRRRDRHGVLEAGVSRPGQMAAYAVMIRPDIVVVTSIKSEHNRSFPSLLDTRAEKVKMLLDLPATAVVVLNGDDPNVLWMATQTKARIITFGFNAGNDVRAFNWRLAGDSEVVFDVELQGKLHTIHTRLLGEHMVYPMLAALAVAIIEKMDLSGVLERLAHLEPETSRMELISLPNGARILDDGFKAGLESIHAALDTFFRMPARRKIIVLGNIEEPPGKDRDHYRELGGRTAGKADLIFLCGNESLKSLRAEAVRHGADPATIHFTGSRLDGVMERLRGVVQPGDLILIKGTSTQKIRRVTLGLMGRKVFCRVKYCDIKVKNCDQCPLLDAPPDWLKNHYVRRSIRM